MKICHEFHDSNSIHCLDNHDKMKKAIYSSEVKILCAWLKEKRELSGLTMRELAKILNTSHPTFGKIELGERRLDVIEWIQYCEALNADPFECLEALVKK